ncbi:hypothetical protein cgR_5023 [Corynebacterium glutamicum R]|uniref:Uncharacterized protein n=1 Tax=Corynebacterium glutamicum (strain R) TaxID=340322 RepID=A0AB72VAN2_CORGB|nr:hypothetical protein cgR_5023 [Corynebacterium glutamicum R]
MKIQARACWHYPQGKIAITTIAVVLRTNTDHVIPIFGLKTHEATGWTRSTPFSQTTIFYKPFHPSRIMIPTTNMFPTSIKLDELAIHTQVSNWLPCRPFAQNLYL